MNTTIEQNKVVEKQNQNDMSALENISIENATYLQNMENTNANEKNPEKDNEIPNFEVDSIELAKPQLFSDDEGIDSLNLENEHKNLAEISENPKNNENTEIKEPELFENSSSEDDFEIPAFLRRQKN